MKTILTFVALMALVLNVRAQPADSLGARAVSDSIKPWLHVNVETSYGWFWQKTRGVAYTTSDKAGKQRAKVGKLCLQLSAHNEHFQCAENADSVVILEKKRGIGIPKRTAVAIAWAEQPALDSTRVELKP